MTSLASRRPRRVGETFARVLLSLPFILGGLQHLLRTGEVAARLTRAPLAFLATALAPADVLVVVTGGLLIAGGLGIALGILTRWAAFGSMALLVAISVTALVGQREEAGPLIKNLAIFGGLLLVVLRGDAAPPKPGPQGRRVPGLLLILFAAAMLLGRGVQADPAPSVEGPLALGEHERAMRVGRVWIGGLLDAAALTQLRADGVELVINLREPAEPGWNEEESAAALGLTYRNVPVDRGQPFTRATFERITALVLEQPTGGVMIHCATGNRAAAWLATYLIDTQGLDSETAIATARRAGMTRPETEARLRALLQAASPPARPARTP